MKSNPTYRYLLLSLLVISLSLSACSNKKDVSAVNPLSPSPVPTVSPADTDFNKSSDFPEPSTPAFSGSDSTVSSVPASDSSVPSAPASSDSKGITLTGTPQDPSKVPEKLGEALQIRGVTIYLGEGKESVMEKLGYPNRIDATEYNFEYYIYNNDYSRLAFVAISNDKVVGYYSNSLDFNFLGIRSGSSLNEVNHALNQTFSIGKSLTTHTGHYTVKVLMDQLNTQKVTGIYVLTNKVKKGKYTKAVMHSTELMVYDLVNSIRVINHKSLLSWSSSAALSAKKHSIDMAKNDYFSHIDLIGRNPGERLMEEGIYFNSCEENIIAGYGNAILSVHGLFNSKDHREVMLNSKYGYTGVGFSYGKNSTYKTYLTQIFYQ